MRYNIRSASGLFADYLDTDDLQQAFEFFCQIIEREMAHGQNFYWVNESPCYLVCNIYKTLGDKVDLSFSYDPDETTRQVIEDYLTAMANFYRVVFRKL